MDLKHIRSFLAVAEKLSFRKAAEQLHISQPPLSRQIKELELELGVPLFFRRRGRITLTEAGAYLKGEARRLLDQAGAVERSVRAVAEGDSETLVVGLSGGLLLFGLPEFLRAVRDERPAMAVRIVELPSEVQLSALAAGKIDLAVVREIGGDDRIHFERLGEEAIAAIYPASLFEDGRVPSSLASFAAEPFIGLDPRRWSLLEKLVNAVCGAAGFSPDVRIRTPGYLSALSLVERGLGWSLLPVAAGWKPDSPDVAVFPTATRSAYGIAWRRDDPATTVAAAVAIARRTFRPTDGEDKR